MSARSENIQNEQCQIEMKTTRNRVVNTRDFRLGSTNRANAGTRSMQEVSTSQLLLGIGRPGTLELGRRSLYIECRKTDAGYQLIFSYSEMYRMRVSSEVFVRKGEVVQVAQVTKDLDTKSRTLGLPQSLYENVEGQDNASYELKVN